MPPTSNQSKDTFEANTSSDPAQGNAGEQFSLARPARHSNNSWMPTVILVITLLILSLITFLGILVGKEFFALSLGSGVIVVAGLKFWRFIRKALTNLWVDYEMNRHRRNATDRRGTLSQDSRPPILYLRSFADDEVTEQSSYRSEYYFRLNTEEEELISILEEQGPTKKLAKPGDTQPKPGAVSVNAEESRWQSTVIEWMMSRPELVVIRAGMSGGLLWELQQASQRIAPERLLILIPYDEREYDLFRHKVEKYLPRPLPPYCCGDIVIGSLQGAIYFNPDWTAHFLVFEDYVGSKSEFNKIPTIIRLMLRPVYEQLNWTWAPPPINTGIIVFALIVFIGLMASCIVVVYLGEALKL